MKDLIVVADTSTLIGLSRINKLALLAELFGEIIIPKAVHNELVQEAKVGSRQIKKAKYIKMEEVKDEIGVELLLETFARGESEVLSLAREKGANLVLVDEKKARKAARRAGFKVMGLLGILIMSKVNGLIPTVKPFIEELRKQGFRLGDKVIERTLKEAGE